MQQPPHDDSWSVKMDSPYSKIYQNLVLIVQRPVVCAVWSIQLPNFVPSSSFMAGERTIIQGLLLSNFHSESKATPNWIKMRSFEKILSCFEMDNATRCGRRCARLQHPHPHLNSPPCIWLSLQWYSKNWVKSNSPGFYHFCARQFISFSLFHPF